MNPDLRNLISLQNIDQKIISLRKQISEIPDRVRAYRDELQQLSQSYQAKVALEHELAKQRRAQESDVDMMRTKLSRLKDQLMMVKTNKEYTAMLHEIEMANDHIRVAEDGILDLMERMESMEMELLLGERTLKTKEVELQQQINQAEADAPQLEAEAARLVREKAELEERIGQELLARYRRIADARKGIALAEAKDELCSACHVRIRPQVFADLLRTEEIYMCDSCSRILFIREGLLA